MDPMITMDIPITIANDPSEAPNYVAGQTTILCIKKAIVVRKGTVSGNSTIDLQLVDKDGNNFLIMTTAALLAGVVTVAQARKEL